MDDQTRQALIQIYQAAIAAADPYSCVKNNLSIAPGILYAGGARYPLADIEKIYIIAAGKAACSMAAAAEDALGELVSGGVAVTKDGHCPPEQGRGRPSRVDLIFASHPVPDERSVEAASRAVDIASGASENDLVLCLLSGGASSLLALPAEGLTLSDKQETTRLLLSCGADIAETNTVRKHLSAIKGGRLAAAARPAWLVSLVVSDVIGDDLGTIASGPTSPDDTTYLQASDILKMRGVYRLVPEAVRKRLENGMAGFAPETPSTGAPAFERAHSIVVGSNITALEKAAELAGFMGYTASLIDTSLSGEARAAGSWAASRAMGYRGSGGRPLPACLITGGETTVNVRGKGLGGRNMEQALSFALDIRGGAGISALFAGTDGNDGPTDAAGAFVDGETVDAAAKAGLDASAYLSDNDSYNFFDRAGGLFKPGPTGTNVMDIGIILVR